MARQLQSFLGSNLSNGRVRGWPFERRQRRLASLTSGSMAVGASAAGATALGATAIGAMALGAVAIGALAIRRLAVKQARVQRLEIDELIVNRVVLRNRGDVRANGGDDQPDLFDTSSLQPDGGATHKREHDMATSAKRGDDAAAGTPGTGENICPDCNGTGLINDTTCENCDGTGRVIQGLAGG